jgi:CoA:oxalate CoA-transferase
LIEDPRLQSNDDRRRHRQSLNETINQIIGKRTTAEWIEYLNKEGVPCGPINDLAQTFEDPQVRHQEMLMEIEQPTGKVKILGFPVKMSQTPAKIHRPSPQLGQHTEEILTNLGYSAEKIKELRDKGVV